MNIWHAEVGFPAEHLTLGSRRVNVGGRFVDLNPGEPEPTPEEIDAILNPPPGPTEMEQLVERITADPAARAALKDAMK